MSQAWKSVPCVLVEWIENHFCEADTPEYNWLFQGCSDGSYSLAYSERTLKNPWREPKFPDFLRVEAEEILGCLEYAVTKQTF